MNGKIEHFSQILYIGNLKTKKGENYFLFL